MDSDCRIASRAVFDYPSRRTLLGSVDRVPERVRVTRIIVVVEWAQCRLQAEEPMDIVTTAMETITRVTQVTTTVVGTEIISMFLNESVVGGLLCVFAVFRLAFPVYHLSFCLSWIIPITFVCFL